MKTIEISSKTFAKIWKLHQPGDDTEEDILSRTLAASLERGVATVKEVDVFDRRNDFDRRQESSSDRRSETSNRRRSSERRDNSTNKNIHITQRRQWDSSDRVTAIDSYQNATKHQTMRNIFPQHR